MFRIWLLSCIVNIEKRYFDFGILTVQVDMKFYSLFAIYKIFNDWGVEIFGIKLPLSRRRK